MFSTQARGRAVSAPVTYGPDGTKRHRLRHRGCPLLGGKADLVLSPTDVAFHRPMSPCDPTRTSRLVSRRSRTLSATARASDLQPRQVAIDRLPGRGRRVAPGLRRSTSSFQLWHAKSRPIVDALEPWLGGNLAWSARKPNLPKRPLCSVNANGWPSSSVTAALSY